MPAQRGTDLVADGQVLADALAPVLLGVAALGASDRADLHLAIGMVVGQTGLPPEDAHALLRGRAWSQDQRLADVVRQVLDRRVTFPRPDGPDRPAG
ncbi:ANTAR domain-containing protein [Cellulomonas endometrii]|uniref:ANTAR domain-containing protein n=1 Tax=Cellulomonas endometrii TaxID=3036301 RepID=UPI0024AD3F2D|nr:ANTAR domain-containing protein [Cellulomonas endometrii]